MILNIPKPKLDYNDTEKSIKQLENLVNTLSEQVRFALENFDIENVVFSDGTSVSDKAQLKGDPGLNGRDGRDGRDGIDGISPTITVKTNTETEYILTITDKNGSYDTPNLKGVIINENTPSE